MNGTLKISEEEVLCIIDYRHASSDVYLLLNKQESKILSDMIEDGIPISNLEGGDPEFSSEDSASQVRMSFLSAKNFYGLDITPFAVEIAKVTMMIATFSRKTRPSATVF